MYTTCVFFILLATAAATVDGRFIRGQPGELSLDEIDDLMFTKGKRSATGIRGSGLRNAGESHRDTFKQHKRSEKGHHHHGHDGSGLRKVNDQEKAKRGHHHHHGHDGSGLRKGNDQLNAKRDSSIVKKWAEKLHAIRNELRHVKDTMGKLKALKQRKRALHRQLNVQKKKRFAFEDYKQKKGMKLKNDLNAL